MAVARHDNLTRAAVDTHMSQPAVTQAITKIEKWVGAKLFERSRTGTFLTREGGIFLACVEKLFRQVESALREDLLRDAAPNAVLTVASRLKPCHVNVLWAIARSSSFEHAATLLGLSRTAVQRTARELECMLGRRLYERSSQGLIANDHARRLAIGLPRACCEWNEGLEEITALAGKFKSRLFIGTQRTVCSSLLASAVNNVLKLYPEAQVQITEGSYSHLLQELRSGRLDFVFSALKRPDHVTDVIEEPLFQEPYCVAGRVGHPLLRQAQVSLQDLADVGWVLPGADAQRRSAFEHLFRNAAHRPTSCITVSAIPTQISIMTSSDRVTLLPQFELTEPQSRDLVALPIQTRIARITEGLTIRAAWTPTPLQSGFRDHLRNAIQKLGLSLDDPSPKPAVADCLMQAV